MVIQHNIVAINAHRQLGVNNTALSQKLEKLSSGYRINVAADDAAGLAISEKMRAQITGLSRAVLNAHDGISLVQTAEGALQEIHAQLNRLEEMAVQAANGIYAADDRQKLQAETDALLSEFDRISEATNFNGIALLDGSLSKNAGISSAAIANTPPPYATPMALSAMSAFGAEGLALEGTEGIQPLGGEFTPFALVQIDFAGIVTAGVNRTEADWSYDKDTQVLTIANGAEVEITGDVSATDARIEVASGTSANITLNNVNISTNTGSALDMRDATVNLTVVGDNKLIATSSGHAGIRTSRGVLNIYGTDSDKLEARAVERAAGIGSGRESGESEEWGVITIHGGSITAVSNRWGAGIGGAIDLGAGVPRDNNTITILGGIVYAQGGAEGAGIGGGGHGDSGDIFIGGDASVTAVGGENAAGVGGGNGGAGTVTITGTATVEAKGGLDGAGIGGGENASGGIIIIDADTIVYATGGNRAAGIGGGYNGSGGSVTINSGSVTATGGDNAAGIGGGLNGSGGIIIINGGTVIATGDASGSLASGAAIGGGYYGSGGNITITGGEVTALAHGTRGAGIGGGGAGGAGGDITITGGIVIAGTTNSTSRGAAVGGGGKQDGGDATAAGAGAALSLSGGVLIIVNGGWIGGGINADGSFGAAKGTTTVTNGNLSIEDPENNIQGSVTTNGSNTAYRVMVEEISFGAYEEVSYTFDGASYTAIADSSGKLYMYLPETATGGTFKITYKGTEYTLTALVKTDHSGFIRSDVTGPVLTPGEALRTGEATGTVKFTSSEAGEYYFKVVEKDAGQPAFDTSVPGITCVDAEQTISLSGLSGTGAKDVYILVKDEAGNVSDVLKVALGESDTTAPIITPGTGERIDETTGKVTFTSNEDGTYYYIVKDADDAAPADKDDVLLGASAACTADAPKTIDLTGLSGNSAKTVYVVVKDTQGNVSAIQPIGLDAYVPKYEVEITLPGGGTFPPNTDITITVDGEEEKVTTDTDGKLVVELTEGDHKIEFSHGGKDYTGTIKVDSNGGNSLEMTEIVPPPPGKGLVLQIGDTSDDYNKLTVYIEGTSAAHLGLSGLSLATQQSASAALSKIRDAIERVSKNRGQLGAYQNRLEHTINNLNNTVENMTAAESRIRDADMAEEMMEFTKYSILAQAAQAMLAQANNQPQQVLQLLQ